MLQAERRGAEALKKERKRRAANTKSATETALIPFNANKLGSVRRAAKRQRVKSAVTTGYLIPDSQNNTMIAINVPRNSRLVVNPNTGAVEGAVVGNVSYFPMGVRPRDPLVKRVAAAVGRAAMKPFSRMYSAGLVSEARKKSARKRTTAVNTKALRDMTMLRKRIQKIENAANRETLVKATKLRKQAAVLKNRLKNMMSKVK
jgi:hypothetical protein